MAYLACGYEGTGTIPHKTKMKRERRRRREKNEPINPKWNGQDAVKRNGIYLILARCADADISVSFGRCPDVCGYAGAVANESLFFIFFHNFYFLCKSMKHRDRDFVKRHRSPNSRKREINYD